jgi:hypothetical protein
VKNWATGYQNFVNLVYKGTSVERWNCVVVVVVVVVVVAVDDDWMNGKLEG